MNGIRRDWPAIKENARSKHHDFEYHSDGESHSEYEVARAVPAAAVPAAARKRMTFVGFLLNIADEASEAFKAMLSLMVDLSRHRLQRMDDVQQTTTSQAAPRASGFMDAFGQQAVDYLGSWSPPSVFSSPSSGAVFSKHVWYWLHTLRWQGDSTRSPSTD